METKKVLEILYLLEKNYPNAKYYLNFNNPLELLVAAILSAQCRSEVVNAVTEKLFKKYKKTEDYAKAEFEDLVKDISDITYPGAKAKNIINACKILVEKHNSEVPKAHKDLTSLPGIGPKTANVIQQNGFDVVEGIVIDTHVLRLAYRLGLTSNSKNADKTEKELKNLIPKEKWKKLPWLMKDHGRAICKAPVPLCSKCFLFDLCPKQGVT